MVHAKELMLGDWVKKGNLFGRVFDIEQREKYAIVGVEFESGYDVYDEDELGPVPLTPEILEKNGFGFTKSDFTDSVWNGWWIYKGLELATACLDKEGNWPCFINIYDSNIKCEYVHQLQHALKIAKIEKEIEI